MTETQPWRSEEVRALARTACASKEPCEYHLELAAANIAARRTGQPLGPGRATTRRRK